ncbi:hypothetical protein AVEN_146262-1 [Araneus ventricosus]|uniref:Uncharacterized protein n=1 Tax=Araneus ventricosus TaxID=182803 RepID=A0A4Y2GHV7_ARAVE|nr:hypothetical protein AVEN_146262-1 [Araneus ventricosus]
MHNAVATCDGIKRREKIYKAMAATVTSSELKAQTETFFAEGRGWKGLGWWHCALEVQTTGGKGWVRIRCSTTAFFTSPSSFSCDLKSSPRFRQMQEKLS